MLHGVLVYVLTLHGIVFRLDVLLVIHIATWNFQLGMMQLYIVLCNLGYLSNKIDIALRYIQKISVVVSGRPKN